MNTKYLRKKLCALGLAVAAVFGGVAVPMAINIEYVEDVMAADDYPSKYKNIKLDGVADEWNFYNRECTSFVAWCLNTRNGINFHNYYGGVKWGNASNWGAAAQKLGITVDKNPKEGSIYWQSGGTWGHVAWVKEISGDKVYCEWYNTNRDGKYHEGWLSKSSASGFIHIKDITPKPATNTYWPITDGYYTIKTAVGAYFLDVQAAGTADYANINIWDAFGAHSGQIFKVARNGAGTGYYIQNLNSGRNVDGIVYNKNAKNGDNVVQYKGDGSNAQQYRLEDAGDGHYYIKNLYNKCLDVDSGKAANGTNVQLWDKANVPAQKWKLTRVSGKNLANIADGDYMIYSKVGNRVLNVAGDGKINGSNIQIWDPVDASGNIFSVSKDGRFVTKIKNKAANRMVDSQGNQNRAENVHLWDYNNGYGQNWYIEDAGDGYVYIRNLWGYYLDVVNGVNANGTNVKTWQFNGSDAQKWKFVKYSKVNVTGVSLDSTSKNVTTGDAFMLTATVSPSNATNKNVTWSSSNTNVATVDSTGIVSTKNPGTATITAKSDDNGITASCTVTVKAKNVPVTGIKLNSTDITIPAGQLKKLTATVSPADATNKAVTWKSANTKIATVNQNGNVRAVDRGQTTITATTKDGNIVASCKVRVLFSDVTNSKSYEYTPVYWAADRGIATGTGGAFRSADICTREQAVTLIWRMFGKPSPKNSNSRFSDVKNKSSYSYKAIMWGSEKGIITGSGGKFSPNGACTREQIVSILWRLAGKPNPKMNMSPFKDVKNIKSYSYKAILWANEKGITTGSNGNFYPTKKCLRREMVTFLYRYNKLFKVIK